MEGSTCSFLEQTKLSLKRGGGCESWEVVSLQEVVGGGGCRVSGTFGVRKGRFEELNRTLLPLQSAEIPVKRLQEKAVVDMP